jgi:hypothetical protein
MRVIRTTPNPVVRRAQETRRPVLRIYGRPALVSATYLALALLLVPTLAVRDAIFLLVATTFLAAGTSLLLHMRLDDRTRRLHWGAQAEASALEALTSLGDATVYVNHRGPRWPSDIDLLVVLPMKTVAVEVKAWFGLLSWDGTRFLHTKPGRHGSVTRDLTRLLTTFPQPAFLLKRDMIHAAKAGHIPSGVHTPHPLLALDTRRCTIDAFPPRVVPIHGLAAAIAALPDNHRAGSATAHAVNAWLQRPTMPADAPASIASPAA